MGMQCSCITGDGVDGFNFEVCPNRYSTKKPLIKCYWCQKYYCGDCLNDSANALCPSCVYFHPNNREWKDAGIEYSNRSDMKEWKFDHVNAKYQDLGEIEFTHEEPKRLRRKKYQCELVVPVDKTKVIHIRFYDRTAQSSKGTIAFVIVLINREPRYGIGHTIAVEPGKISFIDWTPRTETPDGYWEPKGLTFAPMFLKSYPKRYYRCLANVENGDAAVAFRHLSKCGSFLYRMDRGTWSLLSLKEAEKRKNAPGLYAQAATLDCTRSRRLLPSSGDESRRRMRRLAALEDLYSREEYM